MTCVVGLVHEGDVWIGADSSSADGWTVRKTDLPKVFRVGEFLIGYTTSFRMGQILQWHLDAKPQKHDMSDMEYMVTVFAEAVRSALKKHGFAKKEDEVDTGGNFLVGYRGRLYEICSDFQVNSYVDGFSAVGCGESFALGALSVLGVLPPRVRILTALETAAHFSGGVCPPFKVLRLGDAEDAA